SRIRQGLNVESGLNDGVCVPLLIIFLTLAAAEEGAGDLDPVRVVLEEIGFGVVGGVAAGALGAWVLRWFVARGGWGGPGSRSPPSRPRCWPTRSPSRWGGAGSSPPSQPGSSLARWPVSGPSTALSL